MESSIIADQLNRPKSQRGDLAGLLTKLTFDEQLFRMGGLNPAYEGAIGYAPGISKALREELQAIFIGEQKDANGRPLPLSRRTIMARLDIMTTALRTRIEQIENLQIDEGTEQKPEFSREKAETSVRTFLKTAQEILSHPDDRRAFDRGKGTVEDIVIDPRRITDTLLTNLGLEEYIPEKGTKEPEKVNHRAKAIPRIKEMLAHLEPIKLPGQKDDELKYFRLMRMSAGDNEGYILGTQVINGKKVLFKTDLYGAGRRVAHIEAGYLQEIDLLHDIDHVIKSALSAMNDWSEVSEEDLAEIRTGMMEAIDNLENVENKDKVALRKQLELSFTFRDSRGQYNPNVIEARLLKAQRHITARLAAIENISEYLEKDKLKMRGLVTEEVIPVNKFLAEIDKTPKWKKADMLKEIEKLKGLSDQQKYEPYLSFGRKFNAQLEKAKVALDADDLQSAAQEFTKVYLVAKLERAYKELQPIYSKISLHPDTCEPAALKAKLQGIHDRLKARNFAPTRETEEYTPAFIKFYYLLNSLKKRLSEITSDTPAQNSPVTPKQIRKTRMEEVLERVARIPAVGKVISEIRGILSKVLSGFKGHTVPSWAPAIVPATTTTPQKQLTKKEAFKAMKKRIKEFDFVQLAKNLPV